MGNGNEVFARGLTNQEFGDIENTEGKGWLILTDNDILLPFTENNHLHLKQYAQQELPGVPIPSPWHRYISWGMECLLDQGTRLGQAGLNLQEQRIDEDGFLQSTLVNEGPHLYEADRPFDIGKLVVKGEPLKGDTFLNALHNDIYVKPGGLVLRPDEGLILAPVTKRFNYVGQSKTLQIPDIPRGHARGDLHKYLGIEPINNDEKNDNHGLESLTHLAATNPIGFNKNYCMWVTKGWKIVDDRFVQVDHGASRLLKPGDTPWRIMTETLGEIDYIGLELYKSLTV